MDLTGYDKFLSGQLTDYVLPDEALQESIEVIKHHPRPKSQKSGKW